MDIKINYKLYNNIFAVPSEVAEKHLKFASHAQLKVLLYVLKFGADQLDCSKLDITESQLNEAVIYWKQAGIFEKEKQQAEQESAKKNIKSVSKLTLPNRTQVAQRATESREIAVFMQQTEIKLKRVLRQNEASVYVHLIDDEGMKPAVLLMLIDYAVSQNRATISFIENTAIDWLSKGIETVNDAEKEIVKLNNAKTAWKKVSKAFSIDDRRPSKKESELSYTWVEEWGFSDNMLRLAYDKCVDATGKVQFQYISKIISDWHSHGYITPQDVENADNKQSVNNTSYDIDLFKKMIDKD